MRVLLRTACGCERTIEADDRARECIVALAARIPASFASRDDFDITTRAYNERVFRFEGNRTGREGDEVRIKIYEEVL